MSARAEGMDIRLRRGAWSPKAWWVAAAAFAVAASVVGGSIAMRRDAQVPASGVNASVPAYAGPVTGTGPGLAELAKNNVDAPAYAGPVTGTGPGLAEFAKNNVDAPAYAGPVTGTGPGLAEFAKPYAPVA